MAVLVQSPLKGRGISAIPSPLEGEGQGGGCSLRQRQERGKTLTKRGQAAPMRKTAREATVPQTTIDVPAGGFRYIPGVFQYSGGVAALAGFRIERVEFQH